MVSVFVFKLALAFPTVKTLHRVVFVDTIEEEAVALTWEVVRRGEITGELVLIKGPPMAVGTFLETEGTTDLTTSTDGEREKDASQTSGSRCGVLSVFRCSKREPDFVLTSTLTIVSSHPPVESLDAPPSLPATPLLLCLDPDAFSPFSRSLFPLPSPSLDVTNI